MKTIQTAPPEAEPNYYGQDLSWHGRELIVYWLNNVINTRVGDEENSPIALYELVPDTVEVEYYPPGKPASIRVPLSVFEDTFPHESDQLIPAYNCHGLTIYDRKFWIDNDHAELVLASEYSMIPESEIPNNKEVIIGFYEDENSEVVHTCLLRDGIYIHKIGVRKEHSSSKFSDIQKVYPGFRYKYFIKNKREVMV
jgi:hypothetical protein